LLREHWAAQSPVFQMLHDARVSVIDFTAPARA
jgi:hypothetical protein